jgi:hypothetical protein
MQRRFFVTMLFMIGLASSATPALAQTDGVIRGAVTADADGSVVSSAIVELQSGALPAPLQVTTSADGHFAFPRLVSGDYILTVTHTNFQEKRYRLSLKPREVQNVDVAMVLRPVQEAVNVTAEPIPSVFSPGSTHLSAERLAELPLAQQTNLPDAIVTAAPGMIRGHDDFVHIRVSDQHCPRTRFRWAAGQRSDCTSQRPSCPTQTGTRRSREG